MSKAREILEKIRNFKINEVLKWGFDLTGFKSAEDWKKVLKSVGISDEGKLTTEKVSGIENVYWVWKGKGITIYTGNNPVTGEYLYPKRREPEVGYASYIGIEGNEDKVKKVVKTIKSLTNDIKAESPNKRDFI